jgi:glycosyltransferase involved in cell wall biosynthesis
MEKDVLVSVIIPVYNGEGTVAECLSAVFQSGYESLEVIVVDDHSTDHSRATVRQFPCAIIRLEENVGAAAARNRGARASTGEVLFFLDADILIERDTIERILRTFRSRSDIGALFCSYQKDTIPSNFCSRYKNLVHHYTHQISESNAATFCSGFGAVRREVFFRFGGFDERYRSLEDIEFGYRLHQAGCRIYLDKEIQLTHCKRYSLIGLIQSDLFHRAVPWTKIMLQKRIFRNDLNTRINNVLSVPVVFLILLAIPLLPLYSASRYAVLLLLVVFLALNLDFYGFVYRERGLGFTLKTVAMSWLSYLYSGVGLLIGVAAFLRETYLMSPFTEKKTPSPEKPSK